MIIIVNIWDTSHWYCISPHLIASIYIHRYRGNNGDGKGGFDSLNNNEQVFIAKPTLQKYQVRHIMFSKTFLYFEKFHGGFKMIEK